jgi:hypothetical protein
MTYINAQPTLEELRQLRSPFIQRAVKETPDPQKQLVRDQIREFFLQHHTDQEWFRCFTMPGPRWTFERQLRKVRQAVNFVAVERNWHILKAGAPYMPGKQRQLIQEEVTSGTIHGVRSECAKILWSDLRGFLGVGRKDKGPKLTKKYRRQWADRYKRVTAIWLDFCGPITEKVLECMHRMSILCDLNKPTVPIAVTVLKGREPKGVTEIVQEHGRVGMLSHALNQGTFRSFEIKDVYDQKSDGGITMLTVLGSMQLRE